MSNIVEEVNEIGGILSERATNGNIILSSDNAFNVIPFYKEEKYIANNKEFIYWIKNVERQVRTSKEYRAYIRYLKEDLNPPLNHCMIYRNITDEFAPIEMHHGPIFTLFDIVEIITAWYIKKNGLFSSFRIFHEVMEAHRRNQVMVIMLSEAVHKAVHNSHKNFKPKFLDYRMGHGDIVSFLNTYYTGMSFMHIKKLERYMEQFKENEGKDINNFFEEVVTKWSNEVMVQ